MNVLNRLLPVIFIRDAKIEMDRLPAVQIGLRASVLVSPPGGTSSIEDGTSLFSRSECGYDYSNPRVRRRRMINGQVVEPGDFPWSAAVLIKQAYYSSEPRYVCSATLVSSWNVITAAHCLDEDHFRK